MEPIESNICSVQISFLLFNELWALNLWHFNLSVAPLILVQNCMMGFVDKMEASMFVCSGSLPVFYFTRLLIWSKYRYNILLLCNLHFTCQFCTSTFSHDVSGKYCLVLRQTLAVYVWLNAWTMHNLPTQNRNRLTFWISLLIFSSS